ncbi:MAG: POTRA domain-containing protein, partial [Bacteroidales bacterium]
MLKRIFNLLLLLIVLPQTVLLAQTNDSITQSESGDLTVNYTSPPKTYYIADVKVTGVEETMYAGQEFVLINFAGLSKGQEIQIPGDDITNALKRFWRQGLFSDVKILQNKIEGDSVWLEIKLTDRPRVTDIRYTGMKKSEQDDIEAKIGFVKGNQITPPQIDRAEILIKNFYDEKGFGDAEVRLLQHPDTT